MIPPSRTRKEIRIQEQVVVRRAVWLYYPRPQAIPIFTCLPSFTLTFPTNPHAYPPSQPGAAPPFPRGVAPYGAGGPVTRGMSGTCVLILGHSGSNDWVHAKAAAWCGGGCKKDAAVSVKMLYYLAEGDAALQKLAAFSPGGKRAGQSARTTRPARRTVHLLPFHRRSLFFLLFSYHKHPKPCVYLLSSVFFFFLPLLAHGPETSIGQRG